MTRPRMPLSLGVWILAGLLGAPLAQAYEQEIKKQADELAAGLERAGRKRVAVVDFVDLEGNITQLGRFLAEELSVTLSGLPAGLDVVDRNHLAALLKEKKLSAEGLVDPSTTRRLGQILGVDVLITGSLTSFGESVRVTAKALDADTAKMIAASRIDIAKVETIRTLLASEMSSTGAGTPKPGADATRPGKTRPGSQSTGAPIDDLPRSVEQNKFVFELAGCALAGRTATCRLIVNNKSPERRTFKITGQSLMFDDHGNSYSITGASIANEEKALNRHNSVQLPLHYDVPVKTSVTFEDLAPDAIRVAALELRCSDGRSSFAVTFKDISFVANSLTGSNLLGRVARDAAKGGTGRDDAGGSGGDEGSTQDALKGAAETATRKLMDKLGDRIFGSKSRKPAADKP